MIILRYFDDNGCSVRNLTVTPASYIPGDTVTISFTLSVGSKAAFGAVSGNVEVTLGNGVIQYDEDEGKDCVSGFNGLTIKTFTKASIAKGASKAYSFSVKLTDVPSLAWMGIEPGDYLMFSISADAGSGGFYDMYVSDAVIRLAERTAPTISGSLLTDRASMPDAADGSPMEYFGGLLQLVSLPRLRFDFTLDPVNYRDPGLTASHLLSWTCGGVVNSVSANTGYGVTTVTLDMGAPLYSGSVTWTYTVTDSYGMSATLTGTFQVTPYLPPNISAFNCERWEEVLTGSVPQHVSSSSGENIWLSLRATVTPINGMNAWNAVLTYWSQDMQESSAWAAGSQVSENGEILGWNLSGSDKSYKRNFTTNLHTSSDSVARIKVATSSSSTARSVIAATDADDLAGVQKTTSVGGSTAHNNLQPYITVYMWRRTA